MSIVLAENYRRASNLLKVIAAWVALVTVLFQSLIYGVYQEAFREVAQKRGVEWYQIFRGSTFDCALCDSYTGVRIPIGERALPIHPMCMCYAEFGEGEGNH